MIEHSKPFLPDIEIVKYYLNECYESSRVTNNGPLVQMLEKELAKILAINDLALVSNGTIALQMAYKALNLKGSVITTPFSFAATTSSLLWEGLRPIFVDIDEESLNIDPEKIERLVEEDTTAIVATHVFGNPCDIEDIQRIADKYGLKVIYDGAHVFGSYYKENSLLSYGDLSIISFHATKLFNCIEAGGIYTKDSELFSICKSLRSFGVEDGVIKRVGTNSKLSEIHAAFGLASIPKVKALLSKRKSQFETYEKMLLAVGRPWRSQKIVEREGYNFSYFPLIFDSAELADKLINVGKEKDIVFRRYFEPSLNTLDILDGVKQRCAISESISKRIVCLPMYDGLDDEEISLVIDTVLKLH